jgi:hypothetical protein
MRRVFVLAVATLALAIPSAASAYDIFTQDFYGRVTLSNGSVCPSSSCQIIVANHRLGVQPLVVATGVLRTYFGCVYAYPFGNLWHCYDGGAPANAFASAPRPVGGNWRDGDTVSVYARQACPVGGGYHFSPTHQYQWHAGLPWYGGTFQLGTTCQT